MWLSSWNEADISFSDSLLLVTGLRQSRARSKLSPKIRLDSAVNSKNWRDQGRIRMKGRITMAPLVSPPSDFSHTPPSSVVPLTPFLFHIVLCSERPGVLGPIHIQLLLHTQHIFSTITRHCRLSSIVTIIFSPLQHAITFDQCQGFSSRDDLIPSPRIHSLFLSTSSRIIA